MDKSGVASVNKTAFRRRISTGLSATLVVLLVAACGSTVPPGSARKSSAGLNGEPLLGEGSTADSTGSTAGTNARGKVGGTAPGAVAGRAQASAKGATQAASKGALGSVGPGITADAVTIGFQWLDTTGGTSFILGKDVSIGEPDKQSTIVANWINAHGGVAGRKLQLVLHRTNFAGYVANPTTEDNAVCADFTQDHHVFAANLIFGSEALFDCLSKADSVFNSTPLDDYSFAHWANHYYVPSSISLDRGEIAAAAAWNAKGAFADAQVGILYDSRPPYTRAAENLQKALAKMGIPVAKMFAASASDIPSAVVQFRSANVTHVMVIDVTGGLTFIFMNNASDQKYYPKYVLDTNNGLNVQPMLSPQDQLENTLALSWNAFDVASVNQETPPAISPTRRVCAQIFKEAGMDLSSRSTEQSAMGACGALLYYKTFLDRVSVLNSSNFRSTVEAAGTAFQAPGGYSTKLGPGRHDGAARTRLLAYDPGCKCFVFKGLGPDT